MTFRVNFYAEQAFLSFVKKMIEKTESGSEDETEVSAVCVLACAAALESGVNYIFLNYTNNTDFDKLNIKSKIEYITSSSTEKIKWSEGFWQNIILLINSRNWLAHYKESDIGLINSECKWIKDDSNEIPKIDPNHVLNISNIKKYYESTRSALKFLIYTTKGDLITHEYLDDEDYSPLIIG
jgi:hypothetical protein